ncbi:MAG: hypothetical protein KZQ99_09460 [Candidatus Thiodiazotropha sp. (ex Dulcina madagascariensis)]|nr:hypothetical protein [Candidatus Thiodiazotropha sp. (ex Epidulcina cf. delphinae)]MCU7923656.1 hypothetical protein [Candidatus Thiodiazotropha sp. (ex Dulcina madagascariensis)]MCU7926297.1 hypothetical protein [Candidatus Thiodiazotropha sp. (ex Dulcina madagascariensis)]MCU7935094.1 hypothetical protein [Candidatus Thiodiazotropha sp. (ex Dulcina madagascariensis)]
MQNKIPAVRLIPAPSRQLLLWHLTTHAAAFLVIVFAPLALPDRLLLLSLLALYALWRLRHRNGVNGGRVIEARITSSGRSRLTLEDGRRLVARIRPDSLITPWLILLRFDLGQGRRRPTLVLFGDALPKEQARRLRILLNYGEFNQKGQ